MARWSSLGPRASAWLSMLAILSCTAGPQDAAAVTAVTDWEPGFATFYGGEPDGMDPNSPSYGTSEGSCGYGMLNKTDYPYWTVGALATANHYYQDEPLHGCGECYEVQCLENGPLGDKPGSCQEDPNNRTIVVMITDSCPECATNHLDLQALTWAKIAKPSPGGGRINLQYRRVECVPPSDLVVNVDSNYGANRWIRLTINKAGGPAPVKQVQLRGSDSSGNWEILNNLWGATWEVGSQPTPPIDIRIVANNDAEVRRALSSFHVEPLKVVQKDAIPYDKQTGNLQTGVQFKLTDPSDVQPSGFIVDTSRDTVQLAASAPNGEPAVSQATVQAFEGPPENANSSVSEDNSTSRYSGASSSDTGSSSGEMMAPPPAYEAAPSPSPPAQNAAPPSQPNPPSPPTSPQPPQASNASSASGNDGKGSSTGSSGGNSTDTSTNNSPPPPRSASPSPPRSANPAPKPATNNSTSSTSRSHNNTSGKSPPKPRAGESPPAARPAPASSASRRAPAGNSTSIKKPAPRRSEESPVMSPDGKCVCKDNQPYSIFSCTNAKAAGQCKKWWLRAGLYCQKTCGNCHDGCNPLGIDAVTGEAVGEAIEPPLLPKRKQPPATRRQPILADSSSSSRPTAPKTMGR